MLPPFQIKCSKVTEGITCHASVYGGTEIVTPSPHVEIKGNQISCAMYIGRK